MKKFQSQKVEFGLYPAENWEFGAKVIHSNIYSALGQFTLLGTLESAKVNSASSHLRLIV